MCARSLRAFFGSGLLQIVLEADAFEESADDIEDLVRIELVADAFQLFEQRLQYAALAGFAGDKIDDANLVLLFVAMDAAHPLLQSRRIPGDIVIHHQPAELQVDALGGGIGADHVGGAAFLGCAAEEIDLLLAFEVVHRAVDLRDPAGEAHTFETADQEVEGVAMFGKDENLFVAPFRIADNIAKFFELGIVPRSWTLRARLNSSLTRSRSA